MSVQASVGSERNLLDETPEHARQLVIENPILRDDELERLRQVAPTSSRRATIDTTWPVAEGPDGLERALDRICAESDAALAAGANILILSDRSRRPRRGSPLPSLLATAAVHHHLVREGTRLQAGIVVESGEPRSVHSIAVLVGYGAAAVNPYLMLETLAELVTDGWLPEGMTAEQAQARAAEGDRQGPAEGDVEDGDLDDPVLLRCADLRGGRARARAGRPLLHRRRRRGSAASASATLADGRARAPCARVSGLGRRAAAGRSASTPGGATASTTSGTRTRSRCSSTPSARAASRRTSSTRATVNAEAARRSTLRGLMQFRLREDGGIPLDEVEPAAEIVKRFSTGAMSLGSISREAHETLARRHEPDRRPLEHGRRRRGSRPLRARPERRLAPLEDQAGRVGPLRRQRALPRERGRAPDQDGAGREARRGRPAAGPQGRPLHRERPPDDARRRPDLAAAAPRHLLDRGPQAADLRPALRATRTRASR